MPSISPAGFVPALLLLLAWGALAFGSVYPWAYGPLLWGGSLLGAWGLLIPAKAHARGTPPMLVVCIGVIVMAVALQLIPVENSTRQSISPTSHSVLQKTNIQYGAGLVSRHPLSVAPASTWKGLAFVAALSLLFFGTSRAFSAIRIQPFSLGIVALGTLLALIGIVQQPLYTGYIYGFWPPEFAGSPFGPFVNKNHFAGWMIMTLALSLGYYCGQIATLTPTDKRGIRECVLWLSSPKASQLVLIGTCLAVMALSLVLTLSRSGISCLALAVAITGAIALVRAPSPTKRRFIGMYLTLLFVVAIGWAGSEAVARRFASSDWSEFNNRIGAWRDAWQIALRFMPLGSGLNTYATTTSVFQTNDLKYHYVEAHNDYLQLAAEGGLLVGVPALFTLASFAVLVWKRFRSTRDDALTWWIRAGAVTGLLAIALQEVVEFSLQMPGNAALFVVLAAIAIHQPVPIEQRQHRRVRREREVAAAV